MEKHTSASEARRRFGRLLQSIAASGDRCVIERHGEPVAAVVPIAVYEQWKRSRAAFFIRWRDVAQRSGLKPEEAEDLAHEAVQASRLGQNS